MDPSFAFLPPPPCYTCRSCTSILAWGRRVVSRDVLGIMPDSVLLSSAVPHKVFVQRERPIFRGLHIVFTLFCSKCGNSVGWKIAGACGPLSHIFSEGRYILFGHCVFYYDWPRIEDPLWTPSNSC